MTVADTDHEAPVTAGVSQTPPLPRSHWGETRVCRHSPRPPGASVEPASWLMSSTLQAQAGCTGRGSVVRTHDVPRFPVALWHSGGDVGESGVPQPQRRLPTYLQIHRRGWVQRDPPSEVSTGFENRNG